MNRIKKYIIAGVVPVSLIFSRTVNAAVDTKALLSTGGAVNLALLLAVVICLAGSIKIMSLVKGGLMSKSWQMFTLGLVFLIIARILIVFDSIRIFASPELVVTALYLLMTITWLVGIYQTKRILA